MVIKVFYPQNRKRLDSKLGFLMKGGEEVVKHTTQQLSDTTFYSGHFIFTTRNAQSIMKVNDFKFFTRIFALNK